MHELAEALAEVLGAGTVSELQRLSGGASRETFRFRADGRSLVLQRQRGGYSRDIAHEAQVVQAAGAAGVPVAELVAWSAQPSAIGSAYMVLTAVEGETIARKILRDQQFATARQVLPAQLGAALARLHAIDPATVSFLAAADQLAEYRSVLDQTGRAHPAFELAFRWLAAHVPASHPAVLVHGDFRLGNVIVGEHGLNAVIDWELAHLGDPMEDLGWLCVKAWRFGSALPVAGVGQYQQLFDAYEAAGGVPVDPQAVRWWEVFGTLKWGIICITQGLAHTSGQARSHELAAIGRRVCENEHDLFLALEGSW
ncbi:MAG: phosphotransferase family protein [Actinomycetota bacterium]|nr:phosphotransferase family protein [Actinomycetota bacterium]